MNMEELVRWYELLSILPSSRPQCPVNAIVVHSRSHGRDGDGLLELVKEFVPSFAPVAIINGGNGEGLNDPSHKAWPGKIEYLKKLLDIGVRTETIILSKPGLHTRDEAEKFGEIIEVCGFKAVAIANQSLFLPRAMLGWLSEIKRRKLDVKLFPVTPTSLNWRVKVHGQQGSATRERLSQCRDELERTLRYQREYPENFVPIEELIEYLADLNKDE